MTNRIAFITGVSGQDGSYLTEYLLKNNYEVHGIVRRNSVAEHQESRIDHLAPYINIYYSDMLDSNSLRSIIDKVSPTEIYNLAAQSHVRISSEIPEFTTQINAIGPLRILEIIKSLKGDVKFYQASSSEMFGKSVDSDNYQRESTKMIPVSPYGCAKLFAYNITRHYREAYNLFAANGILFNHESPRRASNFVTSKVIKTAVQIKFGQASKLTLGNLDSQRDWGHSRDYVKAMVKILEHDVADDWVVATGETRSIRQLVELVFSRLDLNYKDYVIQDTKFMRPEELQYLRGDASKIKNELGWQPETSFEEMIDEMLEFWLSNLQKFK
jgi:GDPmannose 4,6-dehydratase